MNGLFVSHPVIKYQLLLIGLLVVSLFSRLYNINYNSPFNDEAIYQVIGNLGVFKWDWVSYNAPAWVAGSIFVYPTFSALAGSLGGVLGARILNVIFGVLALESIFNLGSLLPDARGRANYVAGLLSALILGGASVTYYVSRLATYDMPSFYFLLLGLYFLSRAWRVGSNSSRWYFFSALTLTLAVLTKMIVGLYIVPIWILSFLVSWQRGVFNLALWRNYFLLPQLALLGIYVVFSYGPLLTYAQIQSAREYIAWPQILQFFWSQTKWAFGWWVLGTIGLALKRKWGLWAVLTGLALLPLAFHLGTHRMVTLDKHVFLSIAFLALVAGIGLSYLLSFPSRVFRLILGAFLTLTFGFYLYSSFNEASHYNSRWINTYSATNYLRSQVSPTDKILAEAGAAVILATYPITPPANVTTFDWLEFKGTTGKDAYESAVLNGHFNYIQLFNDPKQSGQANGNLQTVVKENLYGYKLAYFDSDFSIYKRLY